MLQLAYVTGLLGAVSLLVAAGAWWNVLRPANRQMSLDHARLEVPAGALIIGFGLSAIAAVAVFLKRFSTFFD